MIELIKSYKYDNKYDYIKTFNNEMEQLMYFDSLDSIVINNDNDYVKDNTSFLVEFNYDYLVEQGVNYIKFNNGFRDVFAFITSKEYVNDEATKLNFEIDVIQTFMFDFDLKKSFVERKVCNLNEITDFDENIEMGEHIAVQDTILIQKEYNYFAMFTGLKDYYVTSEGSGYSEIKLTDEQRPLTYIDGVPYPLLFLALDSENNFNNFKKYLIDHPSLVGVIRFPKCSYTVTNLFIPYVKVVDGSIIKTGVGCQNVVTSISCSNKISSAYTINKSSITDMFPYTYYILTDGECEPLIMKPQYLNSSFNIIGSYALSHNPIERFYPSFYKGSTDGTVYNITNGSVMMLPTGANGGLETLTNGLAQIEQNKKSMIASTLVGGALAIGSAYTGNATGVMMGLSMASTSISSLNRVQENVSRMKDMELSPSTIKSYGTPSTRDKFNTNNVRIIKMSITDNQKSRINNYIERYGNKYNNYATINLKSYKGYLKMCDVDIDGKIDNIYISKIISILERGVYIE